MHVKNKISPYEGLSVRGKVSQTYVRGRLVYDEHGGFSEEALGTLL